MNTPLTQKYIMMVLLSVSFVLLPAVGYAKTFKGGGWPGGYDEDKLCKEAVSEAESKADDYIYENGIQDASVTPGSCKCKHYKETITQNPVICTATASIRSSDSSKTPDESKNDSENSNPDDILSDFEMNTKITIAKELVGWINTSENAIARLLTDFVRNSTPVPAGVLAEYVNLKRRYDNWLKRLERIQKPGNRVTKEVMDQMMSELNTLKKDSESIAGQFADISWQAENNPPPKIPSKIKVECAYNYPVDRCKKAGWRCVDRSQCDPSKSVNAKGTFSSDSYCNCTAE